MLRWASLLTSEYCHFRLGGAKGIEYPGGRIVLRRGCRTFGDSAE